MATRALTRLRKLCLALPEAREVMAWGEPTFRVKTMFAMYAHPANHHGEGRESVWVKAVATNQELMLAAAPDRFFVPPYTGPYGWIGVYLDAPSTDWDELADLLRDAWGMSAPPKLVALHAGGENARRTASPKPTKARPTTPSAKKAKPKSTPKHPTKKRPAAKKKRARSRN